ncbi:threonylcarbamoyl-AMP synthase [Aerococcaceae bacterium DSM 111022]|nr:threonylcarbamoyl-AMP synthase [Aerococcaceae bacterium DSM 111022]
MTEIFKRETIFEAADVLREGGIVAFPTETVYGLGAAANNQKAVERVFEVKGRPQDNPLIVHVDHPDTVKQFVEVGAEVQQLIDTFWPGPLTVIFPYEGDAFSPSISAGQPTVSFRMPDNADTLALIEAVGFPLVGPSANKSGKPSPTSLEHVLHDFDGEIEGVLESSEPAFDIGVESTVIYPIESEIVILRPGAITKQMLEVVTDLPVYEKTAKDQLSGKQAVYSPGVKYTHYSPKQPVYMVSYGTSLERVAEWIKTQQGRIGLLADNDWLTDFEEVAATYSLGEAGDIQSATRELYAGLRYLEQQDIDVILVQGFDENEENAHAVMNRLSKASNFVI